jgi:predicted peptidase
VYGEPIRSTHTSEATIAGARLQYQLSQPSRESAPADGWPLLLFLHGAGERGSQIDLVGIHGPLKHANEFPELRGAVIVAPQCPEDAWWKAGALKTLVDEVRAAHPINSKRIYITGLSMGGYATWGLLCRFPDSFAAAVPICGGGETQRLWAGPSSGFQLDGLLRASHVPIRAFHGQDDRVVPVGESELLIDALQAAGSNASLTTYPGVGHDSWSETYANGELYTWMFAQERGTD